MKRIVPLFMLIGVLVMSLPQITVAASYTASASTTPATVTGGNKVTLTANVKSSSTTKLLVDLEVYNPAGQKVFQQAWDNQSFTAGTQRTFSTTWSVPSGSSTGAYIIRIGLFSVGWGTMYYWNNAAGQFNVSTGGTTSTSTPTATARPTSAPTATARPTSAPTATARPTNTPMPTATAVSGRYFSTLPVGATLPSDAECAAAVKARPENKAANARANATRGNQTLPGNFLGGDPRANTQIAARVTGNFVGTTDEILQWAACKWGIDEDVVRAQAATESFWHQSATGDWTSDPNNCAPGHGPGVDGTPGQCPESFGILQNRYPYEKGAWPSFYNSTAFNADTTYAIWRACYEGYEWWLNDVDKGATYAAGDQWGCVGRWFAGRWHTAAAETYISTVKSNLSQRIWEQASFQEP
ncbi:MAG TPA: hypothetical protein VFT66_27370 [Roseiflexaceae bacterium]|nr:hypothetical protein [Roseiflexaceae bacterium]